MNGLFFHLRQRHAFEKDTLEENKIGVNERNLFILRRVALGCAVLFSINLAMTFFSASISAVGYIDLRLGYGALILFLLFSYWGLRRWTKLSSVPVLYGFYSVCVLYCMYTSAFVTPGYVSVTILAVLLHFPILYLDKSWRVNLFSLFCAGIYLVSIVSYKDPLLYVDECINVAMFAVLGLLFGNFLRHMQLENFQIKAKLQADACTDQLTRLSNRRQLFVDLATGGALSLGQGISGFALLDIDYFKKFNDTYGHQAGDDCLRAVADCLLSQQEQNRVHCYRYGGEEFLTVFYGYSLAEMTTLSDGLRQNIANLDIPHSASYLGIVTVSVGLATPDPATGSKYETLLFCADKALYTAKNQGRNQLVAYTDNLN